MTVGLWLHHTECSPCQLVTQWHLVTKSVWLFMMVYLYLWLESILWWLILTWDWDPVANLLAATVLSGSKSELVVLNHCSRSDLSFSSVLWILDLQECHGGVIVTSASFYVLELSRFLTFLEQAICDWTMGLRPALTAIMKLGVVANLVMSALSQSVTSGYKKWHSSACIVFHLDFYLCVKYTFSQKLTWSSEVWCQNTSVYC